MLNLKLVKTINLKINTMKNILIIGLLILPTLSCKAQIIPIENEINNRNNEIEVPDGTYYKDVNNLFDKYLGTWIGTSNGKIYEFIVEKITYQSDIRPLNRDELLIRYKITNNTLNQVLVDTTTLPDSSPLVIEGNYLDINRETYHLDYYGFDAKCGQNGYISIAVINNETQMNLSYSVNGEMALEECPNGQAEQIIPATITLDKQ